MKKLLLILACSSALLAQSFPGSIYTPAVAKDNVATTLSAPMAVIDTVAVVASSSGWVANQYAYICDGTQTGTAGKCSGTFEIMKVTNVAGNVLTVTRAQGGTSAVTHASGKAIANSITAIYNTTLSNEVLGIENFLGVNGVNLTTSQPIYVPTPYNFGPQTCNNSNVCTSGGATGASLIIGNNSVTMTPVPLGVNGTDTGHPLKVSGGSGATEGCLITGGSGTSGQASGQIIINCANTHSGAFTIASAAQGLPEAISAAPAGGLVLVNVPVTAIATVTIPKALTVLCGSGAGVTGTGLGATNLITVASSNIKVQGCTFDGGATTGSAVLASGTPSNVVLENNTISNASFGININAGSLIGIRGNTIFAITNTGILAGYTGPTYVDISGNYASSVGCTVLNCGAISLWGTGGSHSTVHGNRIIIGGNQDGGLFVGSTTVINDVAVVGNTVKVAGNNSFECGNIGLANGFTWIGNTCDATGQTGSMVTGWEIGESVNGTFADNQVFGNLLTGMIGIYCESCSGVNITRNSLKGWGGLGIFIQHTNSAYPTTNNNISGNILTQTSATSTSSELKLDTVTTGTVSDNVFANNVVLGNTHAGHSCITIADSGSAGVTRTTIRENTVNSCETGLFIAGGANGSVLNNRMTGVSTGVLIGGGVSGSSLSGNQITASTRAYDLSSAAYVSDLVSGITSAFIPGSLVNGSMLYVSDATIANPCAGGGTGAILKELNGVRVCN